METNKETVAIVCDLSLGRESHVESILEKCFYCKREVFLSRSSLTRIGIDPYICCCIDCIGNLPRIKPSKLSKEQMDEVNSFGISKEHVQEISKILEQKLGQKI